LATKKAHFEEHGKSLSRFELQKQMVVSKKTTKVWLAEVNSQTLLAALANLDVAFRNFFRKNAGYPRFKSKKDSGQSFQCPQHVFVDREKGIITLPKIRGIKAKIHRSFEGNIKTCTISKTAAGHYYIAILVEDGKSIPEAANIDPSSTIGIDVGLTNFLVLSDGRKEGNLRFLGKSLRNLRKRNRQLARCKKGSSNRTKKKLNVAKVHDQITKQRRFFHHNIANKIVNDIQVDTIAFENLNIKGMMKNKKLARHIADVSWASFVNIVQYKATWAGKNIIFCSRFAPSSKSCSCGEINSKLKLSERLWQCNACLVSHDRDILAANNIKAFALQNLDSQLATMR
jgi:putative transposase